jgi:hypothetical protein
MANFPDSIYSPRTMVNRTGQVYDDTKTKVIYAEDFNLDRAEIVAIETILGLNPEGTYTSVSDRLDYIEENLGGEAFKVGGVYINVTGVNPATELGYGTWSQISQGQFLVGQKATDTDFDTAEETGGEKTHTLSEAEMPEHTHVQNEHNHIQDQHRHSINGATSGGSSGTRLDATTGIKKNTNYTTPTNQPATAVNQNAGSGDPHNNLPPYFVVYIWKRTA